jgi:hypothetical protein
MGDKVRFIKVIVVVGIISGDNKSGDAICGRFGGKNCPTKRSSQPKYI